MASRRWWAGALVLVVVVCIGAVIALGGDDDDDDDRPAATAPSVTERPTTTSTSSTSSTTTTTAPSTTSSAAPGGAEPGAVTVLSAGPGGGSGEIAVDWSAVAGVTGYRVVRADAPGGPFSVVADFDITTGATTAVPGVVNLWSAEHSYLPSSGTLDGPDRSPWFQYVEADVRAERCFRVVAYNDAGDAPPSAVACSTPR